MPELPDILAYIEGLQPRVLGQKLTGLSIRSPFLLRTTSPSIQKAEGQRVCQLRRIGKRIVLGLEGNLFLVVHLMIAGRFHWKESGASFSNKQALAVFTFTTGTLLLTEAGSKKRASLYLVEGEVSLAQLDPGGLEIFEADFSSFHAALTRENHTLKRALTDPHLFSGIGNAYSDEILHSAKLSPLRRTDQLSDEEIRRLFHATQKTLSNWTTRLRQEAQDRFPEKVTAFRKGMAVHGRYRQPCPDCGSPIQRIAYAANEANYCPACQTEGKLLADRALSRLLKGDWPRTLEELDQRKLNAQFMPQRPPHF